MPAENHVRIAYQGVEGAFSEEAAARFAPGAETVGFPTFEEAFYLSARAADLPENVTLHPTAFAAWVGFLVTAINLLPAGQLDGGHVARGLLGDRSKYLSYGTVGFLLVLGLFYTGWLIFAMLILFLAANTFGSPPPEPRRCARPSTGTAVSVA